MSDDDLSNRLQPGRAGDAPRGDIVADAASAAGTDTGLSLSALLSRALVAFTIEFDNEFERQMPHRTTRYGVTEGARYAPWLVSLAMWSNCMRFAGEEGVRVRELERLARTTTNLAGMERWGYIVVEPDPADSRPKPPHSDWLVRVTPVGRRAQDVWRPLGDVIEERWQRRFGTNAIERLREPLSALVSQLDTDLPDCLPILGYGLTSDVLDCERRTGAERAAPASRLALSALLSRALLAFAIEFEGESEVAIAIGANVLRLCGEEGVRVRDLPRLASVSKEAIATALSFLEKRGYAIVEPEAPGSRVKTLLLTPKGRRARDTYHQLVWAIEGRWRARFGEEVVGSLRDALERVVGRSAVEAALLRGLEPYPDGWRASAPGLEGLPHYPMVLHRGGFPDGS